MLFNINNMKFGTDVGGIEIGGYFIIWTAAVLYSGYHVKRTSEELFIPNETEDYSSGWNIFTSRKKDTSDYEWEVIIYLFYHQFIWLCFHLLACEYMRWKNYNKLIPFVQIAITVSYLIFHFHLSVLLVILCQPILFEIISKFKKRQIIWLCEIVSLMLLHVYKNYFPNKYLYGHIFHMDHVAIVQSLFWINLRCISYAMNKSDKNMKRTGFITILSYCLYLPLFSNGPFISINDFIKSRDPNKNPFLKRIVICCLNLIRFIFWMIVTELFLHYMYVSSISFYPRIVEKFNNWTLCGYGYYMGQFFHMKYVVLYGISTTLAKFENIAAPDIPKCIGRIHLYSDMWRYFDNGLYTFLLRYIYVPLVKNRVSRYLASFITFCFIYVWHGLTTDIMIWAFLNYICIAIESGFKQIYEIRFKKVCEDLLNNAWRQRLSCILAAPLLAISAISNFYFFADVEIGNIFFKRFLNGNVQTLCILFCLYCCCQVSTYFRNKEKSEPSTNNNPMIFKFLLNKLF